MKLIIGLDLSTKCSGYSIFSTEGKLVKYGRIKPKTTLSTLGKIEYIMYEVYKLFKSLEDEIDKVIIEDIYLGFFRGKNQVKGFATLGRLSGVIIAILLLITQQKVDDVIELRQANMARPLVGIKGTCQKAEVQVWVLKNFTDIPTDFYENLIEASLGEKKAKEIKHAIFKKRMNKISKMIEKDTDFGEDVSDAILLGYGEYLKRNNNETR